MAASDNFACVCRHIEYFYPTGKALAQIRGPPFKMAASTVNDSTQAPRRTTWLPYSLRWPVLAVFALYDIPLIIAIGLLYWKSVRNSGLVDDDGSSFLFFASRFLPTLLAVAYTLFATILLDDVKRTQAFARLASPSGASAASTLLHNPGPWWTSLWRSFPSKKDQRGFRAALFCSTVLYVLGILVLSPLSSALLVSQDVVTVNSASFARMSPATDVPLTAETKSTTYFRTISHTLQNVSTSAWINDDYFVIPFWPSSLNAPPLGQTLSTDTQTWQALTTVVMTELDCEPMNVDQMRWQLDKNEAASVILTSKSGSTYGVEFPAGYSNGLPYIATSGGASWSTLASFAIGNHGTNTPTAGVYSGSLVNSSGCSDTTELLFSMNSPLLQKTVDYDYVYSANQDWQIASSLCTHRYHQGEVVVTADLGQENTALSFDEADYMASRIPVESSLLDTPRFQELFLSRNWSYHFVNPSNVSPVNGGPAALLAAFYNNSMAAMMDDPGLVARASQLKQRFLGEVLQDALSFMTPNEDTDIVGTISTTSRRIVVISVMALTLSVTLALQLLLLCVVFFESRLSRRPLGLYSDPVSVISTASLVTRSADNVRAELEHVDSWSHKKTTSFTYQSRYKLEYGSLQILKGQDGQALEGRSAKRCNFPD